MEKTKGKIKIERLAQKDTLELYLVTKKVNEVIDILAKDGIVEAIEKGIQSDIKMEESKNIDVGLKSECLREKL